MCFEWQLDQVLYLLVMIMVTALLQVFRLYFVMVIVRFQNFLVWRSGKIKDLWVQVDLKHIF